MKNIALSFLLSIGFCFPAIAQITVSNAVFPSIGDTLRFVVDNQPQGIVMTAPGGDQHWDLSGLQASLTFEQIFQDAETGPDFASFPGANLYYQTGAGNVNVYLNASTDKVSALGYKGPDAGTLGLDLTAKYNPALVQSRAPIQFFDIKQASSGLLLPFSPEILPGADQLPIQPDSMRIRLAINRLDVVDGWGTLSIPGGSFDVLREKRTEYRETRLDAKISPLGWLDVTDIALQYLQLTSLGVDTTVTFQFLNDQSKEPIAICTTDNSALLVTNVQYKDLNISTGIKNAEQAVTEVAVFPNPAGDVLRLRADNLEGGYYTVTICTITGLEVFRKTWAANSGQLLEELDIKGLTKGQYLCRIMTNQQQAGQAFFIKQ